MGSFLPNKKRASLLIDSSTKLLLSTIGLMMVTLFSFCEFNVYFIYSLHFFDCILEKRVCVSGTKQAMRVIEVLTKSSAGLKDEDIR